MKFTPREMFWTIIIIIFVAVYFSVSAIIFLMIGPSIASFVALLLILFAMGAGFFVGYAAAYNIWYVHLDEKNLPKDEKEENQEIKSD